jgi:chromosome segregation ATPase
MNRFLQYANLTGVVALAVLCVLQWSANRRLNVEAGSLEKTRLKLAAEVGQQQKELTGRAADLDHFREQLARTSLALKETETKLASAGRELARLEAERTQLKVGATNWAAAVAARDERLKEGNERLRQLGEDLNASIRKYNELAEANGKLVKDWNDQQAKLAATRTNSTKPASP